MRWRETFYDQIKLIKSIAHNLPDQETIYLAGLIEREKDIEYKLDSQQFILDNIDELKEIVRKHDPYIGQNAPVFTIAKINAEHHLIRCDGREIWVSGTFFRIASRYADYMGKSNISDIYSYLSDNIIEIKKITNIIVGR